MTMLGLFTLLLMLATTYLSAVVGELSLKSSPRLKRESRFTVDVDGLKENLATIADGLETFQKRSCELGINSHHCALAHLDDVMMARDFLRSGYSPGKRSADLPEDLSSKLKELLDDLNHQMTEVTKLRRMLDDVNTQPIDNNKRTCQFRLGNHCLTEALDRAASQYYYLKSALSPGRRRRQAQDNDSKMRDNRHGSNRRR